MKNEVPSSKAEVPSSKAEVPSSKAEVSSSKAEVPSSKAEVSSSDAEVPSSDAEVSSSDAEVSSSKAEVPSSKAEVPSSKAEVPSSDAEVPSSKAEVPSSDAEVSSSDAEVSSSDAEVSSSDAEVSSSDAEVSSSDAEVSSSKPEVPSSQYFFPPPHKPISPPPHLPIPPFPIPKVYKFTFHPIARKFFKPLVTSHGNWDIRKAIILSLTDETLRVSWGEIAPISWFGSETLEQALDFCRQLPEKITDETIFSIPDDLPACQFGFESAWEGLGRWGGGEVGRWGDVKNNPYPIPNSQFPIPNSPCPIPHSLTYSGLLPAGEGALEQWRGLWEQGYRTFKWKIGVNAIAVELKIFHSLIQALPHKAKLRLDANGGLNYEQANLWLETCDNLPVNIEFIEQPLPVEQFEEMLTLSECYSTAIALDESVATLKQLVTAYQQGWRGIFVIKPGIVGSPSRLRQFCQQSKIDAVFSSVFETAIGRHAALQLAAELSHSDRAVGFGINHFFAQ